jgi:MraZ protein
MVIIMPNFFGSYKYLVDSKGRINIPKKFWVQLSQNVEKILFYVTLGPNTSEPFRCLTIFLQKDFEGMTKEMKKECGTFVNPNNRRRNFLKMTGNAQQCRPDKQGRIMLPKDLLDKVKITNEVKIVGSVDQIELWNPDVFEDFTA